jgi:hypothetical protein
MYKMVNSIYINAADSCRSFDDCGDAASDVFDY